MSVFRVEKNKNYTVMANYHLKDIKLSLKAKGLLSLMLSLPDSWDYTIKGLAAICKDGIDSIKATVKELEMNGYIVRERVRNEKGQLTDVEYTIFEEPRRDDGIDPVEKTQQNKEKSEKITVPKISYKPQSSDYLTQNNMAENKVAGFKNQRIQPKTENPLLDNLVLEKPIVDFPMLGNPIVVKPIQLSNNILNTKELSTDVLNTQSINHKINQSSSLYNKSQKIQKEIDRIDSQKVYEKIIKDNIEYKYIVSNFGKDTLDEIVDIILDAVCSTKKTIRIGGEERPSEVVKSRLLKIDSTHIEYVLGCMKNNVAKIYNIKNYLLTALYNAPMTINHYYSAEVRHDMFG